MTILRVDVSPDLRNALVFWSRIEQQGRARSIEAIAAGLASAAGFLRRRLAQELPLKRMPALHASATTPRSKRAIAPWRCCARSPMSRRSRREKPEAPGPSGFLVVDKPAGWTSHDVVDAARRWFGTQRVGHLGTLDPQATGVLPLAVRDATKLVPVRAVGSEDVPRRDPARRRDRHARRRRPDRRALRRARCRIARRCARCSTPSSASTSRSRRCTAP